MKKRFILCLLTLIFCLAACTPQGESNSKGQEAKAKHGEKIFTMGTEQFTSNLDPASEYWGWYTVRYGIGETLFRLNETLEVEPWLAESYENPDPNTWKIKLKDNIVFSDGSPVTAETVVENLQRVGDMNERAVTLKEAQYTIEENTITIKTKEAKASFINDLVDPYACIVKIDSVGEIGENIIGTGPYKIKKFVPESELSLLPNDKYWNGEPKLDQVIVKKILDKETGSMALRNGEIDGFIELNPQSYIEFEKDENYKADSVSTARTLAMYYNQENLKDINLRKAIHLALDKESISKNLLNGMMSPANSMFPSGMDYGDDKIKAESFNLEAAKKLLEEGGYKDEDGDGYLEKDGKTLDLAIHYYKRLSLEELATETQSSLEKIGIKSNITGHDAQDYLKEGNYDLGFYAVVTAPTGDPEAYLSRISQADGAENFNAFHDPQVDEMIKKLENTLDEGERANLAIKIQEKILEQNVHEYFGFNNLNLVVKKEVSGFTAHPSDYYQITVDLDKE